MKRALVVLAVVLAPASASAFTATTTDAGTPVHWRSLPIPFRFFSAGSVHFIREEGRAAIREAFHRWSDALCDGRQTSLRFAEGEDIYEDKPLVAKARGVEPFGIYFRDAGWPYPKGADSTLAQTNLFFGSESGLVEDADIEINSTSEKFSARETDADAVDLQAVITHEVGHYIGLAHSKEPLSIMLEGYCETTDERCGKGKVAARRLGPDDVAAVCALYPPDGPRIFDDPEPKRGCSTSAGSSADWLSWLALTAVILACISRRICAARA